MSAFLTGVALFLLLNVAAGLIRVVRGPTQADRMLAAQLFGTTGVAIVLLLSQATGEPALRDVALIFALLAVVISVAFVKRGWVRKAGTPAENEVDHGG
jgi:multicomponent Na+:H+ antiporter subunit F